MFQTDTDNAHLASCDHMLNAECCVSFTMLMLWIAMWQILLFWISMMIQY